jgi:hypothetical protein
MKSEEIISETNDILSQYKVALTLRQLFYRLVSRKSLPNTENAYKWLSKVLTKAREEGEVDSDSIEDRSRTVLGDGDFGYSSADGFVEKQIDKLRDSWNNFTMPIWSDQPSKVMIGLEKDALSRLVSDVAEKFRVKTYPTRGYASYTYVYNMAKECDGEKFTYILYFGDYDPSGQDIVRDLEDRLERYDGVDFQVDKIALTLNQIREYKLPPMPAKTSDPRYARFVADTGGVDAVELDALPPDVLQKLVDSAISEQIDVKRWTARIEEIEKKKQELKEKLSKLKVEAG